MIIVLMFLPFQGTKELTKLSRKYSICIGVTAMFEREGGSGNGSSYDEIMTELWLKRKARGKILRAKLHHK